MNTMSARSIISHRMFVAALSHDANGTAKAQGPSHVSSSMSGYAQADLNIPPQQRAPASRIVVARRLLLARMNEKS